jgi:MarR family transcriptional regulator, organic hydroperoxide resistance regulator
MAFLDTVTMAGQHTLHETEHAIEEQLEGLSIDMRAMAGVGNIYRAAGAVRNHLERTVLAPHELTWTGWVVLWVVWVWKDVETRHVAAEAGISKGTLTGVSATLEKRGLLKRRVHPDDARRVLLSLTTRGRRLMEELFPAFNDQEAFVTSGLTDRELEVMTRALRKVVLRLEEVDPAGTPPVPVAATSVGGSGDTEAR